MASFKAKFPVLQELFEKNHRGGGPFGPPSPAGRGLIRAPQPLSVIEKKKTADGCIRMYV